MFQFLIALVVFLALGLAAGGTTTITASGSSFGVGTNNTDVWEAQSFQIAAGQLTEITITWGWSSNTPIDGVTWSIVGDNNGQPGNDVLATGIIGNPTQDGTDTIHVANGPVLEANTTYWLVLQAVTEQPDGYWYNWQTTDGVSSYDGGKLVYSNDGGKSWDDLGGGYDAQCSISTGVALDGTQPAD